jgi:Flp pilus assembly secretin CpaC
MISSQKSFVHLLFLFSSVLLLAPGLSWGAPPPPAAQNDILKGAEKDLEKPPVLLSQGEQRTFHIPGLARFSIGSPAIRAAMADKDTLLVKGVQAGDADIWVWKSDGTTEHRAIEVRKGGPEFAPLALQKPLSRLTETEVYFTGDGVVLRGTVRSFAEAARIEALLSSPTGASKIINETDLAPELLARAQKRMDQWLATSKFKAQLRTDIQDGSLILLLAQGGVEGAAEKSLIERKARSIFPLTQIHVDALADANPTVHFKVYLLELKKSHFRSLGLGWPASQDGAFRVTPSQISSSLGLDLALQALETDGGVKILSKPELVVRAPGEAELFSGGEIPIRTQSAYFSDVTWKTFGLTLRLNVAQSAGDKVRLDIFTEVSRLDPTLATSDNIPGLQSNRMKTQIDARYGKPLLLSGLLQQNMRRQVKGLPFLKDIPVLGALFGSEDYLSERSELVAILVPSTEVPEAPLEQIAHSFPTGELPPRRELPNPGRERALRDAPDYPWNALKE